MVWQLKKGLGERRDLLERNRRVVRIDREKVSVDVVALRAQALECIANASRNDELVATLRRPILAPWDDFPWVQEQQEINERLASQLAR
jgi:DNA-binding SARP family transcriptional activator